MKKRLDDSEASTAAYMALCAAAEASASSRRPFTALYLRGPKLEDVPYPVTMEPNLVVEYYSR